MNRKDFKHWLIGYPDYKEVAWEYNTGRNYQHKQDLAAIFWNGYIYIEQKFESYYKEFSLIPFDVFNDLIFRFRQSFPKTGRIEGINYFDDLIELLMQRYSPQKDEAAKGIKTGFQSSLTDEQIQILFEKLKGKYIDKNTDESHFKAIFKPDPLPYDFIPIIKTKQFTDTLLAYFISELFQKENQSDYWSISLNCFDKAENLKQSLYNAFTYNPEGKPMGYKQIDAILKSIYTPLQ